MVTGCHGYHNASRYLAQTHADRAADTLAKHSFFGLLEAYNASVLLAAHEFKLTGLVDDDFAQSRASASLKAQCSPSKVLRAEAVARLNKLRDACPQRGGNVADWWIKSYGFYWKPKT